MLTCIRVRNFAIIDELEVEFGPGLNVFTGETGAGKSIVVSALQLVLGGKGKAELVRAGAKAAEVEASFYLDSERGAAVRARLDAAGIDADDELVIRRVVSANGRTRAYINGRMVTAGQLGQIANGLADISSQHAYHSLVDARTHLGYLDAFAGLAPQRDRIASAYGRLSSLQERVDELLERHRSRGEREDFLRFQVGEIDAFGPVVGEEPDLVAERGRLRHATRLATVTGDAEHVLYADDAAVCERLSAIVAELQEAAELDEALAPIAEQLEGAATSLEDVASELGRYARGVTVDPARLADVEERLDRLGRLKRKYGGSIEAVVAHRDNAAAELADLEGFEELLEEAEARRDEALAEVAALALEVRAAREAAAGKLASAIEGELGSLGMKDATVEVQVAPLAASGAATDVEGARLSPTGIDRVEFLIAPNRGEERRPLAKIASGGELSRTMLAVKRVLAGLMPAGLYVFDEVDSGVGGAVAEVIGQRLFDVARHSQVLCITHLAPIAVYGDAHFRVHKEVVDERTHSRVVRLSDKARKEEVARMLGGVKITKATRAAAAEMMRGARGGRAC